MRLRDELLETRQRAPFHAHRRQVEPHARLVEQAQHGALTVRARNGADAHIHRAGPDAQADAAILRQPLFRNVELRHDLQARDQRRMQGAVWLHHLAQAAVHTEAHAAVALVRLYVNVACTVARRLCQQGIEQADDGRIVGRLQQVFHRRQFLHHALQVSVGFDLTRYQCGAGLALRVGAAHHLHQIVGRQRHHSHHVVFAQHFADGRTRRGRMRKQRQFGAIVLQQQLLLAREGVRQGVLHVPTW